MRGADMDVRELDRMPRPKTLLPKALAASMRRGHDRLPDTELLVRDVPVDVDQLAAYNRVCGFQLRNELPATYPHIMAFPLAMTLIADRSFPFPATGVVHVHNRITQHRPIRIDEKLTFTVHATRLRPHRRGTQCDVVAEANVDGDVVWCGESTYLHRHRRPSSDTTDQATDEATGQASTPAPEATSTPVAELPGASRARWRVAADTGRRYARVSGDYNPIHQYRVTAALFGFRRAIAHGMWTLARCLAALEARLPEAYTADVAFQRPILLPSTVEFCAAVVDGGWRIATTNARTGKPHLSGSVTWPI